MSYFMEFIIYLLTSSIVFLTGVTLGIYVYYNFSKSLTHKAISLLLFFLFVRFLSVHLYLDNNIYDYPHFLLVNHLTSRIGVPIVFLLVFYHTTKEKLHWVHYFHIIPFFLFILNFWEILFSSAQVKQEIMQAMEIEGYAYVWQLGALFSPKQLELLRVIPFYSYVAAIGYMVFKTGNFKKLPLHLQGFFRIVFWFLLANLLPIIISSLGFEQVGSFLVANVVGLFTTLIITVTFFFIPNFLFGLENEPNLEYIENVETIYETLEDDKDVLIFKVEEFMTEFKPFLSAEFSLKFLEKNLNISGRYISAAIKEKYQLNFKNYINWLRIEYFKSVYLPMITSSEQVNLEDIANELGFVSINTFYIQFHKFLNTTPRAYIDQYLMSKALIETV
ncbi:Helix-turn-helix domain-containing protein [Belliella buryatensis]|uniref:Helix-turn-helix domain-containing protein n=1 Tax=Belliella buryatensis TaxID=1500549 RepID=A0A239H167_9BACT|nr:helix-turn-helix domain-containing protein [Belliella buryatensis]SNS75120.1 Helix-turn-helix domain-containing protein [Belliella buryatensis]